MIHSLMALDQCIKAVGEGSCEGKCLSALSGYRFNVSFLSKVSVFPFLSFRNPHPQTKLRRLKNE